MDVTINFLYLWTMDTKLYRRMKNSFPTKIKVLGFTGININCPYVKPFTCFLWVENYLHVVEKKQKVFLNGFSPSLRHTTSGVPNKSFLGPFWFLFYNICIPGWVGLNCMDVRTMRTGHMDIWDLIRRWLKEKTGKLLTVFPPSLVKFLGSPNIAVDKENWL